jgi:alkylation response protein AidB-like acyl-CoA dehydrogenase
MDFELDEELQLIRNTARDFARSEVLPTADARDREHRFPAEEFRKAAELGFAGMLVAEKYGGSDLGTLALAIVVEEISHACASLGVTLSVQNSLVSSPIVRHATEAQKERWLPLLASGSLIGAYALSEAASGSDAAGLQCKAVPDGGGWRLQGSKLWITSGKQAGVVIVFARAPEGITAFLVPADSPGFSVGKIEEKLGIRSSSTVEIVLDGVRLGPDAVLGQLGKGLHVAFDTLDGGRIGIAAQALGIAQASLDASVKYAGQREQFGQPIGRFQAVQFKIAQVSADLNAARLACWKAAWLRDRGRPCAVEAAQAKLVCSQLANRAADEAVQIHGGAGYTTEFPVARYFRDARITEIYEGTTEIQKLVIARSLLGAK